MNSGQQRGNTGAGNLPLRAMPIEGGDKLAKPPVLFLDDALRRLTTLTNDVYMNGNRMTALADRFFGEPPPTGSEEETVGNDGMVVQIGFILDALERAVKYQQQQLARLETL